MTDWWQRKITALLHDPPDKVFEIKGHKERARSLREIALSSEPPPEWEVVSEIADQIAAATDRLNFPQDIKVLEWTRKAWITHPISGQKMFLSIDLEPERAADAQIEAVKKLCQQAREPNLRFLLLWRRLEEELSEKAPEGRWGQLPADTRIPDHPLLHHARLVSAFASLKDPALLAFSIAPVQSFIASARRTGDLWMGSYLLSYLTWQAVKAVVEKLGPDHVLYPSLLGQPLVDKWLHDRRILSQEPDEKLLRLATFPNKFMALVPAEEANNIAEEAEEAVYQEWQRLADRVWRALLRVTPDIEKAQKIWERQVKAFLKTSPRIYWAAYPWAESPQKIAELYRDLTGSGKFLDVLKVKGKYPHNAGTVYAACFELVERALGARKSLREFSPFEEPGGKCTVCGEREALNDGSDWSGRRFWERISERLHPHVRREGRERLCAVCAVKRFVQRELGLKDDFPSTDSVAAASFVQEVLDRMGDEKVVEAVRDFCNALENSPLKSVAFSGMNIPKLERKAREKAAETFVKIDGEWLFSESFEPGRVRRAHGIALDPRTADELRGKLGELTKRVGTKPLAYYAILVMDGDHMGRWLSGTHEGLPKFIELLHPDAKEQMEKVAQGDEEWAKLLSSKRLVSPSYHAAISRALANFALHCVPYVVEELHPGRLVYAGGDDVLALFPAADVLSASRELRALFSGEAKRLANGSILVEFGSERWTGWLNWEEKPLLMMGNRATASIGIAVVHRLHPLQDALRQAREAEEAAKEVYGRNAVCIRWLKRSGEQVQMGARFYYQENCVQDSLKLLQEVQQLMERSEKGVRISSRFPMALMEEAETLSHLPFEAQEAELLRILIRHSEGTKETKEGILKPLAHSLAQLAQALDKHAGRDSNPYDLTKPQRGMLELAKWLSFLRFLAGGGER